MFERINSHFLYFYNISKWETIYTILEQYLSCKAISKIQKQNLNGITANFSILQHKQVRNHTYYPRTIFVLHSIIQGPKAKFE